jgi:poly-gamma-glutamate synthesis protein (capsule biosynthesis protein)
MGKRQLKLAAVGDIMMGDHPVCIGHGVRSTIQGRASSHLFEDVTGLLQQGDIVFGNLETVLSAKGEVETSLESLQLRAHPGSIESLKSAGFNVLSVANNHIMNHGPEVFWDTIGLLRSNGILPVGLRSDSKTACEPVPIEQNDLRVCFLAYSLAPSARDGEGAYYCFANESEVLSDVAEAARSYDAVVVSLHWGYEFMNRPSPLQVDFGHSLIDNGAALVLGHHPHVLQGIERYRHGAIAYSLGNFVFDMWQAPTRRSVILFCTVVPGGVRDLEFHPVAIENYRPVLAQGEAGDSIRELLETLSRDIESASPSDSESELDSYLEEAHGKRQTYRKKVWRYFFRNLDRYRPWLAIQLALSPVQRGFSKLRGSRNSNR